MVVSADRDSDRTLDMCCSHLICIMTELKIEAQFLSSNSMNEMSK